MQTQIPTMEMTESQMRFALSRLARTTLEPMHLGTLGRVELYQLGQGWQTDVLMDEPMTAQVRTLAALQAALDSLQAETIIVLKDRELSQEDAHRLMAECLLTKTVFWQI